MQVNLKSMTRMLSKSSAYPPLVTSGELPKWLVDNPYILGWCRSPNLSFRQCLLSTLQLHNQTLNIWTHIAGLLLCQYQLFYAFPSHLTEFVDVFFLSASYIGIGMSFFCSVIYHMFNTSSFELSRFLSQLDYFGIILHLIGNMLALVYFVFYNHNRLIRFAYVGLYVVLGAVCLIMNYHCMFSSVTNRMNSSQRSAFFTFIAALSMPPQIYIGYLHSWTLSGLCCVSDLLYVIGALTYSSKWPEKRFPGSFDLFNSHTIFHLFVIAAGYGSMVSLSWLSKEAIAEAQALVINQLA